MIPISSSLLTYISKQITTAPLFYITIDGVDVSARLSKVPSFTVSTEIETRSRLGKANDCTLEFDNTDKYFNVNNASGIFYNKAYTNLECKIYVYWSGFESEKIQQFVGYTNKIRIEHTRCVISVIDKYKKFFDKKIPTKSDFDDTTPDTFLVEYTDKKRWEIIWDILTNKDYGAGLDDTESAANTDIDYESWLFFKNNSSSQNMTGGFYDNETIAEALEEILKVSQANIYLDYNTGKFKITYWIPDAPEWKPEVLILDDDSINGIYTLEKINNFSFDDKDIINQIIIKYDYDKANDFYNKVYVINDATSIAKFGVKSYKIESVFLRSDIDAEELGKKLLLRYSDKFQEVNATTELTPVILNLNDFVLVNDAFFELDEYLFEVISIQKNFSSGKCQLKLIDASIFQLEADERWAFVWDIHTGDTNGSGGDPAAEFTTDDFDDGVYNARTFAWCATSAAGVEIGSTGEFIKYLCF